MQVSLREIGRKIDQLSAIRRVSIGRVFASEGLHFGQLRILEYVIENSGCTQNDIAENLNVSPASIALSTKRLEKSGMIRKSEDRENRRCNIITVTEKGLSATENCRHELELFNGKLYDGVSDEELKMFLGILDRVIDNSSLGKVDYPSLMKEIVEREKERDK